MENYNLIQKVLHDLVLGNKFINKALFELEKMFSGELEDISNKKHIFISGLPRSGTTSILNFLYSTNQFISLKYSDMPFVLAPTISKIFQKNNIEKKERAHSDGISYDLESPESFDEILFSESELYIKAELINFLQLLLKAGNKERYLSKNNSNYKRVTLIADILPNSIFLMPIRSPLQQAFSLFNQHLNFLKLHRKDDFVKRYMMYLGHYEFGLNHRFWKKCAHSQPPYCHILESLMFSRIRGLSPTPPPA